MISSDGYPISVPVMSPGQLTAVIVDEQYTVNMIKYCSTHFKINAAFIPAAISSLKAIGDRF